MNEAKKDEIKALIRVNIYKEGGIKMSEYKITIEEIEEGKEKKEFTCNEYWLFAQTNNEEESYFQHNYNASKLFRGHVQSHVTLINLTEHINNIKNHEEKREKIK